jgi:hypothetical protein
MTNNTRRELTLLVIVLWWAIAGAWATIHAL